MEANEHGLEILYQNRIYSKTSFLISTLETAKNFHFYVHM